ncbi:MAG TPA: hypothetical protein VK864_00210, partial [Longimicrobiales bacterium]|nr:hypothetical protein [Longimicrobiales bacterium]
SGAEPGSALPPLPSDLVRVEVDQRLGFIDLILGPVNLPAGTSGFRTPIQLLKVPASGWLRSFDWSMQDAAGKPLPASLLHHVNLIDPSRRELFAPIALRVIAAGRETARQELPWGLGYPLSAPAKFLIISMFANPTGQPYDSAYLRLRLRYTEGRIMPRLNVFPFYLDAMGLVGEKSFEVPPGHSSRSWVARPATDVRAVMLGGHVHDFARALRLEDASSGDVLWHAPLQTNSKGQLVELPTQVLWQNGGIKLRRDREYRVTVEYFNPTPNPLPHGGMGVVAGIAIGSPENWPAVDPANPEYRTDLNNVLAAPARSSRPDHTHNH